MAVIGEQRKHIDNAQRRDRAKAKGVSERALRGSIDRVAEEELIESAVRSGKVTRVPMTNREDDDQVVRGHSNIHRADPSAGTSFGNMSRRMVR